MKHFHFYDEATGLFHGDALAVNAADGHERMATANAPPGHKPIEGHFDPLSQRVDVATGTVVDYQPPAPSADHQWNADAKRWHLKPEVAQRQAQRAAALAQIAALEAGQARTVREFLLWRQGSLERLVKLDEQIAALRPLL